MILQYTDVFGEGKPRRIEAEITTDHPASSYGMPVVVLPDGHTLDAQSWVLLNYQVISLSKNEEPMMIKWLTNLYAMLGMSAGAAALGRKGGSVSSEAKTRANRQNAKKGGWPKGRPRKPSTDK